MERLTEYINDSPGIDTRKLQFYCDVGGYIVGDIARRLAAYEDTGLEPEEIAPVMQLAEKMNVVDLVRENLRISNRLRHTKVELDRLKTIDKAQDEGQVVVLPCKVGENVYYIFPNCGGYLGYFVSEPYKVTEVGTKGFWTSDILDEQPDAMSVFTPWSDFGKTVFLTRAEAEAAIGGRENES